MDEEEHSDLFDDERDEDRRDNDTGLHFTQPCAQNLGLGFAFLELEGVTAKLVAKAKDSIADVQQESKHVILTICHLE